MITGALVNEKDIHKSLFYPDVTLPNNKESQPDELVFFSRIPQALSTEAEMMTHYTESEPDGKDSALQRIHVTGGTNGILIQSLFEHRPFTPSFVGRAEDQAYLISVLMKNHPALRYLHKPGLIMRHDKASFVEDAISSAAPGKLIGDYIRILVFSEYANCHEWTIEEIKKQMDPFSGGFISFTPLLTVYVRFALKLISLSKNEDANFADGFAHQGVQRLDKWIRQFHSGENVMQKKYKREQQGWNLYYDILDRTGQELSKKNKLAMECQKQARMIMKDSKLKTGSGEHEN